MNDKIKQLAGQALDQVVPYTWTRLDYEEIQKLQKKFAELIIQECIDYCGENLSKTVGGALKIHFGVKE